jgi:hypothetical protein
MRKRLQRRAPLLCSGANQLRRRIDKMESVLLAGLAVGFLLGAPLLALGGAQAAKAAAVSAQRQEKSWRQVSAVLQESGGAGVTAAAGDGNVVWVAARWPAPDGGTRTGVIAVNQNSRAGERVPIWVTPSGEQTNPPLSGAEVGNREVLGASIAVLGLAVVIGATAVVIRLASNRRRMEAWAADWTAASARWTSRH